MIPSFLINHILTFVQLAHVLYMLLMALLFWKKKIVNCCFKCIFKTVFIKTPQNQRSYCRKVSIRKIGNSCNKLLKHVFPCMNIHGKTIYKAYKARFKVNIWFNHHLYSAHQGFS